MMSVSNTCFNCNTKIEDDSYGLTQCPSCHTLIFIDFDGHVQKPPEDKAIDQDEVFDDSGEQQEPLSSSSVDFDIPTEATLEDQNKVTNESEGFKDASEDASFQEALDSDLFSDKQKSQSDFDIPQDNFFTDISSQETNESGKNENSGSEDDIHNDNFDQQKVNDEHLQDVVDYANSSDNLDSGGFYYNIIISGIDSKNLRESVLDALDDNRFGWKKEEINGLIKNGQVTIEKVNAAKTYILISYLKFLPIKVKWDQISIIKS